MVFSGCPPHRAQPAPPMRTARLGSGQRERSSVARRCSWSAMVLSVWSSRCAGGRGVRRGERTRPRWCRAAFLVRGRRRRARSHGPRPRTSCRPWWGRRQGSPRGPVHTGQLRLVETPNEMGDPGEHSHHSLGVPRREGAVRVACHNPRSPTTISSRPGSRSSPRLYGPHAVCRDRRGRDRSRRCARRRRGAVSPPCRSAARGMRWAAKWQNMAAASLESAAPDLARHQRRIQSSHLPYTMSRPRSAPSTLSCPRLIAAPAASIRTTPPWSAVACRSRCRPAPASPHRSADPGAPLELKAGWPPLSGVTCRMSET